MNDQPCTLRVAIDMPSFNMQDMLMEPSLTGKCLYACIRPEGRLETFINPKMSLGDILVLIEALNIHKGNIIKASNG